MSKNVLVVIDMQNDFIDGALGSEEAQAIVPKVKQKIYEYNKNGDPIIFTRDTHDNNYLGTSEGQKLPIKHCIRGTDGWQIGLEVRAGDYGIINKRTFGYLKWENALEYFIDGLDLKNVTVEICGLDSDICVVTNALIIKTIYPDINVMVCLTRDTFGFAMKSIFIKVVNRGNDAFTVKAGDGFAQGIFTEFGITEGDAANGIRNGGFGSTTGK